MNSSPSRNPSFISVGIPMSASKPAVPLSINKDFEIPSIPLVLIRIIQTLDKDKSSARELEALILHDPALAARILRLANSAFYSFRASVKTISHAIPLLGINIVTSLAIGINIFDTFTKGAKSESALINELWTHSFGVAMLVKEVWAKSSRREKEGEFAFLCGLLHDIGKVILFKKYPGHYGPIFASAKTETDSVISFYENENYGADHAVVGEMLAKQWGFPEELAFVIRRHHEASALKSPLISAVMLADLLAKELKIGYDGDDGLNANPGLSKLQSSLGISDEEYEGLKLFASKEREGIQRFFKVTS
jgi:putative nucleotidyltransferase with HDIG domain